uniref:Uncharacterized protein n=1 Tax=Panagrellus redivivus TaxID=6233 RepID=A0A7E4VED4_PANRE
MTFVIENVAKCTGDLKLCYKALTPDPGSTPPCEPGFQQVVISKLKFVLGFRDTYEGPNFRFALAKESRHGLPPDISDGFYHYQILELPQNCNFKILGATDPTPPGSSDSLKTAKLVIYILAGLAGAILLVAIGAIVYCVCFRQRR